MSLRIRQIVVAAHDLDTTVDKFTYVLGTTVCYRDPAVAQFGLVNALMVIGDQFLEVVSPTRPDTAASRHLERLGDSGYMLILQTDDLAEDKARIDRLGVRIVWESIHPEISAIHLHPKDIGAAIVSLDQPVIPEDWPWAGKKWSDFVTGQGAQKILSASIGAVTPEVLAERWAEVLGTQTDKKITIPISQGQLDFKSEQHNKLAGFTIVIDDAEAALARAKEIGLPVEGQTATICGTGFTLVSQAQ